MSIEKYISSNIPLPVCAVSSTGKILGANNKIEEVFLYKNIEDADLFALTGIRTKELFSREAKASEGEQIIIERNGHKFNVVSEIIECEGDCDKVDKEAEEPNQIALIYFYDVTRYEELKSKYEEEKVCVAKINIDNYDQFNDAVSPETGMAITTEVNKMIRKWAQDIEGSVDKIKESQYVVHFHQKYLDGLMAGKFELLDQVRALETSVDFPLSLSMGIGVGGDDLSETANFAAGAMDLALGRGGDQAVVKNESRIQYYGGKTQSVEKSNKGKSRVVGHALKKLMEESKTVLIMGHKHGDIDCFGSSLGIYRMCIACKTDAHIVIEEVPESLKAFYQQVEEAGNYSLIKADKAKNLAKDNALVVVLDTHRPSYVEAPELLEIADKVVVIDHHRRAEETIENPTLAYIESYASSTAELVTEILQYILNRKVLIRLEAEALLAGMTIDTNRFAVKTGVRTFEAAAWLRRSGADTAEVKRFFQMNPETFKIKAKAIANAEFLPSGIATAICEGMHHDVQVINAQVADELLDIKGIKATFVAGKNKNGITCVSARSLGDVNVQVILERFGGGGHLNVAGAQVNDEPEEIIKKILEEVEEGEK